MPAATVVADPAPSPRAGIGGPKTPEGKARSSMNAMKHGLRARHFVLLPDEDAEEFQELVADLTHDLRPQGRSEVELVAKIAVCIWKEMRGDRMEGELLAWLGGGTGPGSLGRAMGREVWGEHEMNRVIRYQGYAGAQLNRTLAALRASQAERRALAEAEAGAPGEPLAPPESKRTPPAVAPQADLLAPVAAGSGLPEPGDGEAPPSAPAAATAEPTATPTPEAITARLDACIRNGALATDGIEALIMLAESSGVLPAPCAAEPARMPCANRSRVLSKSV